MAIHTAPMTPMGLPITSPSATPMVTLVVIARVILRYGVRLPIGSFFAVCAGLMALLAIVFTGHGVKALQEAGLVPASPIDAVSVGALGIYPTRETALAQIIVLLLVVVAFAWAHAAGRRRETSM